MAKYYFNKKEIIFSSCTGSGNGCILEERDIKCVDTSNNFIQVPPDDESSLQEDDEDLAKALRTIEEQTEDAQILVRAT